MSFTGFSIAQAQQLDGQSGRLDAVESLAASKVAQTVYDARVASVDTSLTAHSNSIAALVTNVNQRVAQTAYDAKIALVDAKDAAQDTRLTAVESLAGSKVDQSVYATKMSILDAKDVAHEGRLDAVEALAASKVAQTVYSAKVSALEAADAALDVRVGAIETDISGRVQAAINEKVAQTVFDSLASELRDADSALTAALATKVAAETQSAVDAAQDELISQKATVTQLGNLVNGFNAALTELDESKVANNAYNAKIAALEEFIQIFMLTYTIQKPSGQNYAYTGEFQNALVPPYVAESPINLAYDAAAGMLTFALPSQAALDLNFVDVNVNGTWLHFVNPDYNIPNTSTFTRSGSLIFINLSGIAVPTGQVLVFTRYDSVSQSSVAGQASITV